MVWSFVHSAREMVVGAGSAARAAEAARREGRRRPVLVLDPWFQGRPPAEALAAALREACGTEPVVCAGPPGEPDLDAVAAVQRVFAENAPDLVAVLGGGSAMDTAKVARMLAANPGPAAALAGPAGVRMAPHPSLFIALPTTAGTGSEVSESAVITAPGETYKMIFRSPEMTPHLVLLDPELAASAPPAVTAASGLDAVTHAVEAFWSRAANPITDMLAREAMRLLAAGLPAAHAEGGDLGAREQCLVGSSLAAMAFNSAHLGLAHAISGALGALHHTGHGVANALALPHVAAFNAEAAPEKAAEVARIFGGESAAAALFRLRARLGLDLGLDAVVPPSSLDAVAEAAMRSGQIRVNPRAVTLAELRAMLERMRLPSEG